MPAQKTGFTQDGIVRLDSVATRRTPMAKTLPLRKIRKRLMLLLLLLLR
jgi:hypothetical protein